MNNAGIAQLVEHNLAKVGVAGSNPVSRSIKKRSAISGLINIPKKKKRLVPPADS